MDFLESTNYNNTAKFKRNFLIVFGVILLLGTTATSVFFYQRYTKLQKDPANVAQADNVAVVSAVSKLILVPEDEQPTIATVTDPSKLSTQSFFAHAKVGDKVLLYAKAKKAILYDPTANKIVEVAPIDLDDANAPSVSGTDTTGGTTIE